MKRRDLLRYLGAGVLGTGLFASGNPFKLGFRSAWGAGLPTLIVIFQRGGCDGLNAVVPYGEDEYYRLRPSISVPAPGAASRSALRVDDFFGLHPSLTGLHTIYNNGDLAIMPAVHYPNGNRSHFDSEIIVESGADRKMLYGWLGRYLMSRPIAGEPMRAIGLGNEVPHSLRGEAPVATFNDLTKFGLGNDEYAQRLRSRLRWVYEQSVQQDNENRKRLHENGLVLLDHLEILDSLRLDEYQPGNGAEYPNSTYGKQLMQIAQLIKKGVGLEIATVNIGGWDTHASQGGAQENGRQARRLKEFSDGISALYQDLGARMEDVLILTMTEFGRTAKQNASGGTDHGNASAWFACGGQVKGGIYGEWPGLDSSSLYHGRYLAHTIDCRDVMGEVLSSFLGARNLAQILPDHTYRPIGFL